MPVFPDCGRPLTADVVITGCDIVEDHLDEISRCAGFLMMDGGDALYDFDLLGRRQPRSSARASVGWHLILQCRNGGSAKFIQQTSSVTKLSFALNTEGLYCWLPELGNRKVHGDLPLCEPGKIRPATCEECLHRFLCLGGIELLGEQP